MARACVQADPACLDEAGLRLVAEQYANTNATDGASSVDVICGNLPTVLMPCGPQPANLTGCLGTPPTQNYVEVHVSTISGGGTVLPPSFAQTLSGSNAGTTVGACARAAWGDISVLAITIDQCIYNTAPRIAAGSPLRRGDEYAIQFWFWDNPPCEAADTVEPRSPDIAGLLDGANSRCEIAMSADEIIAGRFIRDEPMGRASDACRDRIRDAWLSGETIYLPVYDTRTSGPSPSFHHTLVAPFVVTAFQLGIPPGWVPPATAGYDPEDYLGRSAVFGSSFSPDPCGTNDLGFRCLTGIFAGDPIPAADLTGSSQIRLVG
jgi:hypothetical protein